MMWEEKREEKLENGSGSPQRKKTRSRRMPPPARLLCRTRLRLATRPFLYVRGPTLNSARCFSMADGSVLAAPGAGPAAEPAPPCRTLLASAADGLPTTLAGPAVPASGPAVAHISPLNDIAGRAGLAAFIAGEVGVSQVRKEKRSLAWREKEKARLARATWPARKLLLRPDLPEA